MGVNPYRSAEQGGPGRIGWRIHYFGRLPSTQDAARELALDGAPHGSVVIAEEQTAGRGRQGRCWHSPSGGLYLTVILRPRLAVAKAPALGLVAAVAVAETLESVAPGLVAIKWPNDIWLRGKKAAGILPDALTEGGERLSCVLLGIGMNLNLSPAQIPAALAGLATSVLIETGRPCDRVSLAGVLFSRLQSRYMESRRSGFAAVLAAWEKYSALTGAKVTVADGTRRASGVVKGVDGEGALILESASGIERVLAGEVHLEVSRHAQGVR
jgi:BirA family biotin operon repressor/biotin-[acetyl-CoA-carboxylase] ligase